MLDRLLPRSEHEIQTLLEGGLLTESHHFDLKRELKPGSAGNRSLAIDLASFAVDGGAILFGVDEKRKSLHPIDLSGLKERVDNVARSSIDEPLYIQTFEIPSNNQPELGYLLVQIPLSPAAPHMVNGRYCGRGDTTNITLSNAEVTRLYALRQERSRNILEVIDQDVDNDPTPDHLRAQAHLFIVGLPVPGHKELLHRAVGNTGWEEWLRRAILGGPPCERVGRWSPDLESYVSTSRRHEGYALHTYDMGADGQVRDDAEEGGLLELAIGEDGSLRLFCGRATAEEGQLGRVVFEELVVGLTKRVVLAAKVISDTSSHYGSWDFAIAITKLRGTRSYELSRHGSGTRYSGEEYRNNTRASYAQLSDDPNRIVDELVGQFGRGLRREFRSKDLPF